MKKNLYIVIFILILSLLYLVSTNTNNNPSLSKNKRISCQNKTITFEKINKQYPINDALELIKSGNYTIKTTIDYSKYMKSHLINILNEQQASEKLLTILKQHQKEKKLDNKNLDIDFYIYENDKEDKRKKGDKCKLYAGYVMLEFKLDNKLLYKIQSDYMQTDISDMDERIQCAVKSFISIN